MGSNIPLPALQIRAPQPGPDPIEQYSRLQAIRNLMQGQQTTQLQQTGLEQENQQRALALQDQNGLHQAMIDSGGDPDKLRAAITDPKYNITPNGAFSAIKMLNEYKQSQIALDQATRKDNIDSDSAIADQYQKIAQLPSDQQPSAVNDLKANKDFLKGLTARGQQEIANFQYGGPDSVTMMAHSHLTRQALDEQAEKEAAAAKSQAQANQANANTAKITGEQDPNSPFYNPSTAYLNSRAAAGDPQAQAIQQNEVNQAGSVAGAQAKARLPYEQQLEQTRIAAENARQNADKQVIAFDPQTKQRVLVSADQVQAQGLTNPVKASQGDIEKAGEFNAQANDVQLNTSKYRVAINSVQTPFSQTERANVEHILSDPNVNSMLLNAAGFPAVISQVEQGSKARDFNALPPEKQDALVGYLRMKGAAIAYQKMLTNQGRTSKEGLDIELANIPSPILGATVANKQLDSFQQNIDTAAQRAVKLPWMDTPADVRQRIENAPRQTPQPTGKYKASGGNAPQVGERIPYQGSFLTVSQAFPDGTFNAQ